MNNQITHFFEDAKVMFQAISNNTNDYTYVWDFRNTSYMVSQNMAEDFCIQHEGSDFLNLWQGCIHARDIDRVKKTRLQALRNKQVKLSMEYQVTNSQGNCIWLSDRSTVFYDKETGEPQSIIGVLHNLSYDGDIDTITGLMLHTKCRKVFDLLQSNKLVNKGCLMLLGIDEFTSINTLNDHTFGDLVLRATSQDILNFLPDKATMYRYDGDQLVIIADKSDKTEVLKLYEKIQEYTSKSHIIQNKTYRFTISAGIARYPEDGNTWFELEKAASIALKFAKGKGKNRYAVFTSEMYKEKLYEQVLGDYLADSVEHNFKGFKVDFQPVCFAQTLEVRGAEILLRFVNPKNELIGPNQFIHLLEQSQLIIPVGLWVLEEAIKACKKWTKYVKDFVMNINVSYIQLRDISFCDSVEALLKKYDLDVRHIVLELTESYFITDASNINISMDRLRELHLQVAMDDFGTGYSSLARLSQFNVDVVKIDRSFVQSLHKSKYNHDFIDSVVRLCHNIGMKVCVEGVETKEEQESISVLNSDYIQGFYVSKPIDEETFFKTYIMKPHANDKLVVIPNLQLRHEQLMMDKDVLSAMMDATPLGLSFWNREIEPIACNEEILQMFKVADFKEFKENINCLIPEFQPDGRISMEVMKEVILRAYNGEKVVLYWEHCTYELERIPAEITVVRIPYLNDYIIASYSRDMREQRAMEEQIRQVNAKLEAILEATPLCLNLFNRDLKNTMCNQAAVELFGLMNHQEYLEGFKELSPKYQPDGRLSDDAAKAYIVKAFETGYQQFFWMHRNLNDEMIPSEITLVKIKDLNDEKNDLVAGYTRDIRNQLENQHLQQQLNERIRAVLDSSPLTCILWSEDLKMIDCNQVALNMLGAKDKNEIMNEFDTFLPLNQPDGENSIAKKDKIFSEILYKNSMMFEWVYVNRSNEEVPSEVTLVKIPLEKENIIVAYSRDLRELHHTLELNDRLSKMAYYDLLTGVTSRAHFTEEVESAFQTTTYEQGFALGLFDIDYFKSVNDSYGHVTGDIVLKKVAKAIEKMIPKSAMLGRYGGDEFIIEFKFISPQELAVLMEDIVEHINTLQFEYNGKRFTTSISMGASFKTASDTDYNQLLTRADRALYVVKKDGRNGYRIM